MNIIDDHVRPGVSQRNRDGFANAGTGAGDQGFLADEKPGDFDGGE
jgi:hypothetical protein